MEEILWLGKVKKVNIKQYNYIHFEVDKGIGKQVV
jgi:hypothetical protein